MKQQVGESFSVQGGIISTSSSKQQSSKPTTTTTKDYRPPKEFVPPQPEEQVQKKEIKETVKIATDSLQLTTKIEIQTPFEPKRRKSWSLEGESSAHLTTFELITNSSDEECKFALSQLLIMVEEDECDRFYVIDETAGTVGVIGGPQTAFWSGTTTRLRSKLINHGIEFTLPSSFHSKNKKLLLANSTSKKTEEQDDQVTTTTTTTTRIEKPCTIYFNSSVSVRGMVEALSNVTRKETKLRIIASCPFPGCTIKVSRSTVKETGKSLWITTCEGFFTTYDVDKLIRAFAKDNDITEVKVSFQWSPLTKELDKVVDEVYKESDDEQEEDANEE